jgi:hypothetical protein
MTRCGGVRTSTRGETALGRGKGGDDVSWTSVNLIGPKNKKIDAVDSTGTNER